MNPLGVALVIVGCGIALATLATLAVVYLVGVGQHWSFGPRYRRGHPAQSGPAGRMAATRALLRAHVAPTGRFAGRPRGRRVAHGPSRAPRHLSTLIGTRGA